MALFGGPRAVPKGHAHPWPEIPPEAQDPGRPVPDRRRHWGVKPPGWSPL